MTRREPQPELPVDQSSARYDPIVEAYEHISSFEVEIDHAVKLGRITPRERNIINGIIAMVRHTLEEIET